MNKNRLWLRASGVLFASGLVLAAAVPSTGTADASPRSKATSGLAHAQALVASAQAPLNKWSPPGPAVSAKAVKGKTIAYVPDAPSLPYTTAVYAGFSQAAKLVGAKPLFLSNDSTPSGWEQNIDEAVSLHVAAIVLQGIPSGLVKVAIKAANAAKIPVIETSDATVHSPLQPGIAAQVQYPVTEVGKVMAAYAIAQSKGAVDAAVIDSSTASASIPIIAGIRAEFKVACPKCTLDVVTVAIATWATKIPQEVSTLLQTNSKLNWIMPLFDSEMPYVEPTVVSAGAQSRVHAVSFNATPGIMKYVADHEVLAGDVGNPEAWFGYEFMDQVIRLVGGYKPLPTTKEYDPIRLLDTANFTAKTLRESQTKWYGTAGFAAGYAKLWKV
jgi:ABC-type sugar transport system substrate-binding protein